MGPTPSDPSCDTLPSLPPRPQESNHRAFPPSIKAAVRTLLLCHKALRTRRAVAPSSALRGAAAADLGSLPVEVVEGPLLAMLGQEIPVLQDASLPDARPDLLPTFWPDPGGAGGRAGLAASAAPLLARADGGWLGARPALACETHREWPPACLPARLPAGYAKLVMKGVKKRRVYNLRGARQAAN